METNEPAPLVCATDFSPESASALRWATRMARRLGRTVELCHVVAPPSRDLALLAADAATFEIESRRLTAERLRSLAAEQTAAEGVPVVARTLAGEPHVEIVAHAARTGACMLVIGACGRSTVERWMLGSVAERTVRGARCPVVVVPKSVGPSGTMHPDGPRSALVGLNDDGGSAELLQFVAALRRRGICDVTFLHLYWPIEQYARLGLGGPRDLFKPDPEVIANIAPKLRSRIGGLPGHGRVDLDIRPAWGEAAANLLWDAERQGDEHPFDLIVVGRSLRPGRHTIAERLVRQVGDVPVVCVPGAAVEERRAAAGLPRVTTVLAATDLSATGNGAMPHAYALLAATGGVVELCTIHEHGQSSPAYAYEPVVGPLSTAARARLASALRALVPAEAESLGITTHVSVIEGGTAGEAIAQAAERLNADTIVVGSHGRTGFAGTVLGSVAMDVIRRVHRPVLVVRGP